VFASIFEGGPPQGGAYVIPQTGTTLPDLPPQYNSDLVVDIEWRASPFTGANGDYDTDIAGTYGLQTAPYDPTETLVALVQLDFSAVSVVSDGATFNAYAMEYQNDERMILDNGLFKLVLKRV
jgi:hypothetical protein